MTPKQTELTWPAFSKLRQKWLGRVDVQGVSLVALSFFRDEEAATKLADIVAEHKGLLGAAVCCAERGGHPEDDWTTCEKDRDELLDRIFILAKERNLDIDFHTDENGNELAKGLRYVAQKTIEHGYQGRVVCGHCCSLAYQLPDELEKTLNLASEAGITVVSLPLVNQWTQDRDHHGGKTPRWRGITLLHEAKAAGVPVAIASDNTRDQFYAYGDLDMLEVFTQGCRIAHLDRPYGDWVQCVTSTPANAMGLKQQGRLFPGGGADFIIFRARRYSELLSRPQLDRVVVRKGKAIGAIVPDYCELDYVPEAIRTGDVPVFEVSKYGGRGGRDAEGVATSITRLGQSGMLETVRSADSQHSNGGMNGFGALERWSGHIGSGNGGRKRSPSLPRGGASISNAGLLAVFAVLAAVFAVLASTYGIRILSF
jgi:cytosine/adenosine deaminase-related metal-dependent hydrolase